MSILTIWGLVASQRMEASSLGLRLSPTLTAPTPHPSPTSPHSLLPNPVHPSGRGHVLSVSSLPVSSTERSMLTISLPLFPLPLNPCHLFATSTKLFSLRFPGQPAAQLTPLTILYLTFPTVSLAWFPTGSPAPSLGAHHVCWFLCHQWFLFSASLTRAIPRALSRLDNCALVPWPPRSGWPLLSAPITFTCGTRVACLTGLIVQAVSHLLSLAAKELSTALSDSLILKK